LSGFGGFESLVIKELPPPEPKGGHVLVAVKAFGVNQAETHMRKGEWGEAAEDCGSSCERYLQGKTRSSISVRKDSRGAAADGI
jgi:hypothetical protein